MRHFYDLANMFDSQGIQKFLVSCPGNPCTKSDINDLFEDVDSCSQCFLLSSWASSMSLCLMIWSPWLATEHWEWSPHYALYKAMPLNLDDANVNASAATYSKANLITCLKSEDCSVTSDPLGTNYLYSNIGIGLLGLALMSYYKAETYEDLLTTRLTKDLDMTSTSADLNKYTEADNVIEGNMASGERVKPATMGVLAAAGAVLSIGEDMLKLMKKILDPRAQWKKTMEIATTPIQPGIAFAIDIDTIDSMKLFSKSGEQAGYSSLIMWNYKTNSGIVALGNRGFASKSLAKFLIKVHRQMGELL